MKNLKFKPAVSIAALTLLLSGCAQLPSGTEPNPADPWEGMNRSVHTFNSTIDKAIFKPVAETYVDWTPKFVRTGVSNFLDNLRDPGNALNNTLQGKPGKGVSCLFRFVVNSTVGIVGFFDVASAMGIEPAPEDFGQTLGVWGVPQGPYLELPFLGPTTVRDVTRYPVSWVTHPATYALADEDWYWGAGFVVVDGVDARARLLPLESMRASTVDEYAAIRDAYLASREAAVRDGEKQDAEEELKTLTPLSFEDDDEGEAIAKIAEPAESTKVTQGTK